MNSVEVVESVGGWLLRIGDLSAGTYATREGAELWAEVIIEGMEARAELSGMVDHGEALADRVRNFEMRILSNALHVAGQNHTQAARTLGIKRTTLVEKIKRYELGKEE